LEIFIVSPASPVSTSPAAQTLLPGHPLDQFSKFFFVYYTSRSQKCAQKFFPLFTLKIISYRRVTAGQILYCGFARFCVFCGCYSVQFLQIGQD